MDERWYDAEEPDHNPNLCGNCGRANKVCGGSCFSPFYGTTHDCLYCGATGMDAATAEQHFTDSDLPECKLKAE